MIIIRPEDFKLHRMIRAVVKQARAGLQYAASGQYQNYPVGVIELGIALDGLELVKKNLYELMKKGIIHA